MDCREIEVLAPYIGPHIGQERFSHGPVAGHRMGLDHRRPFPVLSDALVIEFGGLDRHGERRGAGIGAQPEVCAEDVAVGRGLRQQLHQQTSATHEVARHLVVAGDCRRVAVVEQDEVDVARVVEFARPELAHAEDGEGRRLGIAAEVYAGVARELKQDRVGKGVEASRGELAERSGDLLERPDLGNVGHGDGQRHVTLEPTQRGCNGFRQHAIAR